MNFSGDKLRQVIEDKGLKIDELASSAGISRTSIFNYMNGDQSPSVARIARIAQATGKPVDFFLVGEHDPVQDAFTKRSTKMDEALPPSVLAALLADHREERRALLAQLEQANQERSRLLAMLEATQRERERWQELIERGQQERLGWQALLGAQGEESPARIPSRWETGAPPDRGTTRPPLPESAAKEPLRKAPPPSSEGTRLKAAMRTKHPQKPEE